MKLGCSGDVCFEPHACSGIKSFQIQGEDCLQVLQGPCQMFLTVCCCGLFRPIPIDVPYRPLNFVSHGVFMVSVQLGEATLLGFTLHWAGLPTKLQDAQGRVVG